MSAIMPRKRAGTYNTFHKRYQPVMTDTHGSLMRDWRDPLILAAFDKGMTDDGIRLVWTVVEGDRGTLYLVPGFATVNYLGRVLCTKPWPDEEEMLPGYVY